MDAYQLERIYQLEQRKKQELREICDLVNSIQNKNNLFINFSGEDLEKVYQHVKEKDLNTEETIQLLKDLSFV